MNPRIASLEKLLNTPRDGALLRFSLGNEYLKAEMRNEACEQFTHALRFDPHYSAAWKILGRTLQAQEKNQEAIVAFQEGIRVAQTKGDIQAVKEMNVFLKRLLTTSSSSAPDHAQ